jgi:hypothetical protein
VSVVQAPIVIPARAEPAAPRSSLMARSPTSVFGSNCRRFMFG